MISNAIDDADEGVFALAREAEDGDRHLIEVEKRDRGTRNAVDDEKPWTAAPVLPKTIVKMSKA